MNYNDTDNIGFIIRDDPYGFRQGVTDALVLPTYSRIRIMRKGFRQGYSRIKRNFALSGIPGPLNANSH